MRIAIVTDSSADMSKKIAKDLGIYVLRMPMTVGEEGYVEEETMLRSELIEAMLEGKSVSTSQPSLYVTLDTFKTLLKDYDHIIYLPISSCLSGTYETALTLVEELDNKLTVVDTKFVSWPLQYMAIQAKKWADNGVHPLRIKEELENESFMYAALIPEDIQYLKRGGRIKPAAAAVANLLKIFPVLQVTEGEIDLAEKVRTHKKAVLVGVDKVLENANPTDYDYTVLDGGCSQEQLDALCDVVEERINVKPQRGEIYPIVLAHTGPGTIALVAVKKYKETL